MRKLVKINKNSLLKADILKTLDDEKNLFNKSIKQLQNNPIFHFMGKIYDQSSYNGLFTNYLNYDQNFKLIILNEEKNDQTMLESEEFDKTEFHENNYSIGSKLPKSIMNKKICPSLENFRNHFMDQSMIHQTHQSLMPGESILERTPRLNKMSMNSLLKTNELNNNMILEDLNNETILGELEDNEQVHDSVNLFDDNEYQVEDFSENRRLREDFNNSQLSSQKLDSENLSGYTQFEGTRSESAKYETQTNLMTGEFQYWACIEPENWKIKEMRIKRLTKKKTTRIKQKKSNIKIRENIENILFSESPTKKNCISSMEINIIENNNTLDYSKINSNTLFLDKINENLDTYFNIPEKINKNEVFKQPQEINMSVEYPQSINEDFDDDEIILHQDRDTQDESIDKRHTSLGVPILSEEATFDHSRV